MTTATIRVGSLDAARGGYPLTLATDDGEPPVEALLPESELRTAAVNGDDPLAGMRAKLLEADGPTPALEQIGRHLHRLLCRDAVAARWEALAAGQGQLRLVLDIADRDLRRLPWELMRDEQSRLATRDERPLARAAPGFPRDLAAGPSLTWPLRILVVNGIAEAAAAPDAELAELPVAFRRICGLVDLELLAHPSRETLRKTLREMEPHVLHVIAHGDVAATDSACLLIHDAEADETWEWTAEGILEDMPRARPRLAVLNACRSAVVDDQEHAWGVAEALLELGVPAVIGMQGDISGPAAAAFSRGLYGALAERLPIDVAVTHARLAVSNQTGDERRDWALPCLLTAVAPERVLATATPLPVQIRGRVEDRISGFIDRAGPRRQVWRALALAAGDADAEENALIVAGPDGLGKTQLVRWCLDAAALNGRNTAYVDLKGEGTVPFLRVLGLIAQALSDSPTHGDRNTEAFEHWRDEVDALLGDAGRPPLEDDAYHRVFPANPPEKADRFVFTQFTDALRHAAADEPLIFALDHVVEGNVTPTDWTTFLAPRLIMPITLGRLQAPVRVIVVPSPDYRAALRSPLEPKAIELEPLPAARFRELARAHLLYRGYDTARVDGLLSTWLQAQDWEPADLQVLVKVAKMQDIPMVV